MVAQGHLGKQTTKGNRRIEDMKRIVKSYGWIVALAIIAGGLSSTYYTNRAPDLYQTFTTVLIGPSDRVENIETALRSLDTVSQRNVIATYAQIPTSRSVLEGVWEELALSQEKGKAYRVRTSVLPDTNIIRITVQGPTPQLTADFANSVVRRSQQLTPEFYDGIVSFKVLDKAELPVGPIDPGLGRKAALGALFGLLVSLSLALLIERLRFRHTFTPAQAAASS